MTGPHDAVESAVALEARGLRCSLGGRGVLHDVDLDVPSGALLALVGPSGCGKSTLLRALAGLVPLEAGRVLLAGRDVTALAAERRRVGLVFQDNSLFGHLRVERNVAFGLRHLPRRDRVERVAEMLDLVGLGRLARRYPHQLSGGEQQRVALARALAPSPEVVLLDEPFGALDESLREELGWEVRSILSRRGTAAVLVTHDRHEALTLGDQVAVMEAGRIVQRGTPREVYQSPASRFVAGFIAVSSYVPTADGGEVLVRPHEVRVVEGGPHTVERVEFLGPTHRYTVRTADGAALVSDVGPDIPLAVGSRCDVEVLAR
ncbi:MAG: ABC transporter ATP-binding protein [Ilumatobacteraceae bacterium]